MPKFGSFESKRRTAVILKYFSPEHSHLVIPDTPEEIPDDWEFTPDVTDTDIRDISLRVTSALETAGDPLSLYTSHVDLPARHVLPSACKINQNFTENKTLAKSGSGGLHTPFKDASGASEDAWHDTWCILLTA